MSNQMTLVVKKRNSYGRELVYPVCEHAKKFCELLGTKTFTKEQIQQIRGLNIDFTIDPNELTI
tara:strand:- start:5541 stop:5732 length:192 start_codon:yes stop_codon:yes gene_type:complete